MTIDTTSPTPAGPAAPASPASTPMLDADHAGELLDRVVYEQILECIDLDELCRLEQSLALTAADLPGMNHQRGIELARTMLDRAFRRLPDDIRTYLRAIEALRCSGCELCEEEAREARSARSSTGARRGPRLKS